MGKPEKSHRWDVTPTEARRIQQQLREEAAACEVSPLRDVQLVAGVDVSLKRNRAIAAATVLTFPELEIVEVALAEKPVRFPYVPGLLSFREIPAILAAMQRLVSQPDVVLVDGQGIAHPRRFGLASHLGALLAMPTVGCAKSRLIGTHEEPSHEAGYYAELVHDGELIGGVLRTRTNVKPLYVSVGHMIDLPTALNMTWSCCVGYRLPEPTRRAHQAAGGSLRWQPSRSGSGKG